MEALQTGKPMLLVDAKNDLGEGPVWCPDAKELIWVDFNQGALCTYQAESKTYVQKRLAERLMLSMPTDRGNLVLAVNNELWLYSPADEKVLLKKTIEENKPNNRLNDGKCDAAGRLWIGTMDDGAKEHEGALYCIDSTFAYRQMDAPFTIPNGIAWNRENTKMFVVDSIAKKVFQYDFDLPSGSISNRTVFIDTTSQSGLPDGMCIDEEDNLWIAFWEGQSIVQYSSSGEILQQIEVPINIPTSCCFGGDDLKTLFITSSRAYDTPENISKSPEAGGLFAIRTEVRGTLFPLFKESK